MRKKSGPEFVLLAGRPGAGKSTAGRSVVETLKAEGIDATHFSMGDRVRAQNEQLRKDSVSETPRQRRQRISRLFPEFAMQSTAELVVVDGYPRFTDQLGRFRDTLRQAGGRALFLCEIDIPDELAHLRIAQRGRRSRRELSPAKRLQIYHEEHRPTIEALGAEYPYHTVDGQQPPGQVANEVVLLYQTSTQLAKAA